VFLELSVYELSEKIKKGEVLPSELLQFYLERVEEVEGKVKAFLTLDREGALNEAREVEKKIKEDSDFKPLSGIPLAVKDNICTKNLRTTCASQILKDFIPIYDATVVKKVRRERAVILGKTNMDEFAMGSSTENSSFYPTHNPWDLQRVPGGSSGGSAASVAAGEAPWALGSDTGGSIRQPAALCGVVGMKPTYGLVSRYGLVAFASSLDQIGPITKDVRDCAFLLNYLVGHDPKDSTSYPYKLPDYLSSLEKDIKGIKVGVVKELSGEGIEEGVKENFYKTVNVLEKLGAIVEEVSLPSFEYALSAYYIIAPAEASSNLARYDGVRYGYRTEKAEDIWEMYKRTRAEGFGQEVKRRIMLGTYALSAGYYEAYYGKAQKVRTLIIRDFEKAFKAFDALVSPTSPTVAFKIGEKVEDPLKMYMSDVCTIPINLAGLPAISIPCGLSQGLPVGFQIIGKSLGEETIISLAYALEKEIGFEERPPL
jgi:aspartyl-tRNA(Asn)/glutamyl-tRNA(Gln) amidotransferase subunit A